MVYLPTFAIDLSQMYVNIPYSDGMGTAKLDPFNWCLSTNIKFSSSNSIDLLFYNARNESGGLSEWWRSWVAAMEVG